MANWIFATTTVVIARMVCWALFIGGFPYGMGWAWLWLLVAPISRTDRHTITQVVGYASVDCRDTSVADGCSLCAGVLALAQVAAHMGNAHERQRWLSGVVLSAVASRRASARLSRERLCDERGGSHINYRDAGLGEGQIFNSAS